MTLRAGPGFHLDGTDPDADTERIMSEIAALLPAEARLPRIPSDEELARTYPDGRIPADVGAAGDHESARRPGSD